MTVVRPATVEDAEVIGEIHVEGWQSSYAALLPADYLSGLDVERKQQMWTEVLSDPGQRGWTFVAEVDGLVVGFLAAAGSRDPDTSKDAGEIRALYLRDASKGRGVGAALLRAALQRLTESGFDRVTLNVLEGNTTTRSFYERFGFALDGAGFSAQFGGREVFLVRYAARLPM